MSRVGVDYIQDYFLPSFTYGPSMITPYPDMANSVGCPAGTHVSTLGCSPRKSEGDTQTTHRRTKSKRSPPQLALRLWANLFSLSGGELPTDIPAVLGHRASLRAVIIIGPCGPAPTPKLSGIRSPFQLRHGSPTDSRLGAVNGDDYCPASFEDHP